MLQTNKNRLIDMLSSALKGLAQDRGLDDAPTPRLERPKAVDHGDVACNIALQLSKAWKLNPRDLAQALVDRLQKQAGFDQLISSCEIAGPGFINFRLSNQAKTAVVGEILSSGVHFGELTQSSGPVSSAMIEFVSANPTGPLHVGHGRQAALLHGRFHRAARLVDVRAVAEAAAGGRGGDFRVEAGQLVAPQAAQAELADAGCIYDCPARRQCEDF